MGRLPPAAAPTHFGRTCSATSRPLPRAVSRTARVVDAASLVAAAIASDCAGSPWRPAAPRSAHERLSSRRSRSQQPADSRSGPPVFLLPIHRPRQGPKSPQSRRVTWSARRWTFERRACADSPPGRYQTPAIRCLPSRPDSGVIQVPSSLPTLFPGWFRTSAPLLRDRIRESSPLGSERPILNGNHGRLPPVCRYRTILQRPCWW
jgi:hypothetical protein